MELSTLWTELHWREPWWLLLALQPFLILSLRRWRGHRTARLYAAPALLPWVRVPGGGPAGALRTYTHVIAWLLLALAAAGPRLPRLEPGQTLAAGTDWVIAVDVSRSMTATDVAPSRLKRARIELQRLLGRVRGDRVGLIVYAGDAHLVAPPTRDSEALSRYLALLQPDLLPTRGSRADRALDLARSVLGAYPHSARAVLLVTDSAGDPELTTVAAQRLAQAGIPLYVFGIGSAAGTIELDAATGRSDGAIDVPVASKALRSLAQSSAGRYAQVADDDSDLQRLYDSGIATQSLLRPDAADLSQIQWRELYPWLLLPAAALLIATLVPLRWPRHPAWLGAVALAFAVSHLPTAHGDETATAQQAFHAYQLKRFRTALDLYSQLSGFDARLGEGASAYRLGDFERARTEFTEAVLQAPNDRGRGAALLNLGNTYFQNGDYRNAEISYRDALRYRPDFDPAQRNLVIAKLLAEAVARQLAGNRPGRGRRSVDSTQDGGNGPFTLGDAAPQEKDSDRTPPPSVDNDFTALLARGVRHAQVAAAGAATTAGSVTRSAPSAGSIAHMQALQQDPSELWRRIFELQEGFPAPLPEPRSVPGVDPW